MERMVWPQCSVNISYDSQFTTTTAILFFEGSINGLESSQRNTTEP